MHTKSIHIEHVRETEESDTQRERKSVWLSVGYSKLPTHRTNTLYTPFAVASFQRKR